MTHWWERVADAGEDSLYVRRYAMTSSGTRCTIVLAVYTDDLIVSGRREEAWVCFWEIHSHFGFSKGSISDPYGRSVLGMELVRGPHETGRRSLFLHQSGYALKICEEYAKEARKTGRQKENSAKQNSVEGPVWFMSLMIHGINPGLIDSLAAYSKEQIIQCVRPERHR